MTETNEKTQENAGVNFPPPLLFILGFGGGVLVHKFFPMNVIPNRLAGPFDIIGQALFVLGLAFVLWGLITFFRFRTAVFPNQPASQIVSAGPYRFSRNPMYLGFTLAYLGGILKINTLWPLLMLPVVLWLLIVLVIRPEERYLTKAFAAVYTDYVKRVRRWL